MTIYRFVQLSDIHFGQERDGEIVVHSDVRSKLTLDAAQLAESRGQADLIVVVGDVAYSGLEDEYVTAGDWLDQLASAVKCRETDVRVVPGNHDCDRKKLTRLAKNTQRTIRSGSPKSAYADLDDMAKGKEEANPLLPKLSAYRVFAAGYESDFQSIERPVWEKDFDYPNGVTLRLIGMNSVQVSDDEDTTGNMVLGNTQYILPADNPSIIYAAVMHHPLDWYMDKAEAKQYLHNRARLVMVGHEHIPGISKTTDELNNEWLDIYSGATNPPDPGNAYRYTYNWIEIQLRERDQVQSLVVTIFPRVWMPEKTAFAADIQRLGGKDSAEFTIACPGVKVPTKPARPKAVKDARIAVREETGVAPEIKSAPAAGNPMANDNDEGLARLKLFFWRYLDWQQRLKVLVQADALPTSAEKPVPQTMERLALEHARQRGKLYAIWEAMMEYVPPEKRQGNPFTKTKG
jgi:predicted phosphodiesterase